MKRVIVGLIALVAMVAMLTLPQPGESSATSEQEPHPIVGSWRLVSEEEGVNVTALYTFASDGTATKTDLTGVHWHGAWQSEESDRVAFVVEAINPDSSGMGQTGVFAVAAGTDEVPFSGGALQRIVVEIDDNQLGATPST